MSLSRLKIIISAAQKKAKHISAPFFQIGNDGLPFSRVSDTDHTSL